MCKTIEDNHAAMDSTGLKQLLSVCFIKERCLTASALILIFLALRNVENALAFARSPFSTAACNSAQVEQTITTDAFAQS